MAVRRPARAVRPAHDIIREGGVRLVRVKAEVLQIQQRRLVIRHGHAVGLDLERQMPVAQLEAQPPHLLHGRDLCLDQMRRRDAHRIHLAVFPCKNIALVQRLADAHTEFRAVLGGLGDTLLFGLEPLKRNIDDVFRHAVPYIS